MAESTLEGVTETLYLPESMVLASPGFSFDVGKLAFIYRERSKELPAILT